MSSKAVIELTKPDLEIPNLILDALLTWVIKQLESEIISFYRKLRLCKVK